MLAAIRDWSHADVLALEQGARSFTQLAVDLMEEEKVLRSKMDPQVNDVLKGKRLKLYQRMCEDAGVGGESLFQEITEGFRLIGKMRDRDSGQFPCKVKPASLTVEFFIFLQKSLFLPAVDPTAVTRWLGFWPFFNRANG